MMKEHLTVKNMGRISYMDALVLQHSIHDMCVDNPENGTLLLLEHNPVITLGVKNSSAANVLVNRTVLSDAGIELVETDRGGDVTYHGPGQLVGYPIFSLRELGLDLHSYLRALEQVIIDVLAEYGLAGNRNGPAGVWVGDKKLCSIGVAVRKMTTYHGLALNVNPVMDHFRYINPCGLDYGQISSLAELLGYVPEMDQVRKLCSQKFASVFGFSFEGSD